MVKRPTAMRSSGMNRNDPTQHASPRKWFSQGLRKPLKGVCLHAAWLCAMTALQACGGASGSEANSGPNKTYLSVQAGDPDGDTLRYEWRATAGSIENRNAAQTVWTMPDGPGVHFAYVVVSDAKGGYTESAYAVSTDRLETTAKVLAPVSHAATAAVPDGGSARYVVGAGALPFQAVTAAAAGSTSGASSARRLVYLPDVRVALKSGGVTVQSATTDLGGELALHGLVPNQTYEAFCTTPSGIEAPCGQITGSTTDSPTIRLNALALSPERNLRLHGHVALTDGSVCGVDNAFAGLQSAATAQLLDDASQPASSVVRVNRFGDYAIDAAVVANAKLKLRVSCEGLSTVLDVPVARGTQGYVADEPVELSHVITNQRPSVVKLVANGPEGSVRGATLELEGAAAKTLPGAAAFLAYKGQDTQRSACNYYKSLGAVRDCDAQGRFIEPITYDDWKRQNRFAPHTTTNQVVDVTYINRMDLNLVRRMQATKIASNHIAFVVCNHPGPATGTPLEIDATIDAALRGERLVACVAMEWSVTPGANGGQPFTKFLTFGPDGSLLASVNLDGRGEKFMPGTCVACHGGGLYAGKFKEQGAASPHLASKFLTFDTGNYAFHSSAALSEAAQSSALFELNDLVRQTEGVGAQTAITTLVDGWYRNGSRVLDKAYVPPAWRSTTPPAGVTAAQQAKFYTEVVGAVCRTCHVALPNANWETMVTRGGTFQTHVCGGTSDLARNASMPNALVSRDQFAQKVAGDPELATLMQAYFGCVTPLADPVYPKK
jgi:hypothetical protein